MEKDSKDLWSSFSGYDNTALAKYIKNYWPHLEVTPILRIQYNIGLLVSNRGYKLRRRLATWQNPYRYGRSLSLVPIKLSFCRCAYAFTTLRCLCYNCEKDPCSRSWSQKIHSRMGISYTIQPSKSDNSRIQVEIDRNGLVCCPLHLLLLIWVNANFGSLEWGGKNEGPQISHSSRDSRPFDGDLEWYHFEDVQSVFREWQIRLNWVMENGGEYYSE
jgi:hypothetical protein